MVDAIKGGESCTSQASVLCSEKVGDDGARAMAEVVKRETCTVHTLDLRRNGVGADGARELEEAQALSRPRRRHRNNGLLRAIVMLAILRQRACEAVFHPKRLRREGVFRAWAHEG